MVNADSTLPPPSVEDTQPHARHAEEALDEVKGGVGVPDQEERRGTRMTRKVTFDKAGVVALGCNIHDQMIGFVVVLDTPYAAKVGASGQVVLSNLPPGGGVVMGDDPVRLLSFQAAAARPPVGGDRSGRNVCRPTRTVAGRCLPAVWQVHY